MEASKVFALFLIASFAMVFKVFFNYLVKLKRYLASVCLIIATERSVLF